MAIELKLEIKDDGTAVIKKFRDTTVKSMKDVETSTGGVSKKTEAFGKTHTSTVGNAISQIKNLRASYLIAAGAIGATIGMVGAAAFSTANKLANYVEQVTDLADATGISTKTIQVFGEAAKMSGETFQDASQSINLFYRQIGAAKSGSKDAIQTFQNLGISLKDTNGNFRDGEEILLEVADKLTLVSDKTDRASYLQDLFGRSGIKMSETIERLAKEYDPLLTNLDHFNMLIDDSKREKVEKYLKTTREWKTAWEGLSQSIGQKVLPVLTDLTRFMTFLAAGPERLPESIKLKKPPGGVSQAELKKWYAENYPAKSTPEIIAPKPFGFGRGEITSKGMAREAGASLEDLITPEQNAIRKEMELYKERAEEKKDQWKFDNQMADDMQERIDQQLENEQKYAEALDEINKSKADSYWQMSDSILTVLAVLGQKSKEWLMIYKGAAIIETTISAIVSGQKAFENTLSSPMSKLLGPLAVPAAIAARVAAYAQGIAQVAMISSQSFQSGGILLHGPRAYGSNEVYYKGTPGEGVLTREGVDRVGGARGIDRINRGRGIGGGVVVNVHADRFDKDFVQRELSAVMARASARLRN